MMIFFLVAIGALIVLASYMAKWDTKKQMDKLRADEAALKEKRAKK